MRPITYADLDHVATEAEKRIAKGSMRIDPSGAYEYVETKVESVSEWIEIGIDRDDVAVQEQNPLFLN